ncbi:MAG TPA: MBL fold metallo-hydrolase [Bdellovibrionota bacterium]|nr:MBL fold metallo-hydrolase [Bdellovibrionota bacterium]
MKIHHLSCGTLCPLGGYLMDGFTPGLGGSKLACHCLLIETDRDGLVLVDTGFGTLDVSGLSLRVPAFFRAVCRPRIRRHDTALSWVKRLGYSSHDVRHILLTHLDFDHAGGLVDFPQATVHLMAAEKKAAEKRMGFIARGRYRPIQFKRHEDWELCEARGEKWFGFDCVRQLQGLPPEILFVPLTGHTLGHAGVAVRSGEGWLLDAGDAYFHREEVNWKRPRCTPGLRSYQLMMDTDRDWRRRNQQRLRELARDHSPDVRIFSSHDWVEFSRLRDESMGRERKAA